MTEAERRLIVGCVTAVAVVAIVVGGMVSCTAQVQKTARAACAAHAETCK